MVGVLALLLLLPLSGNAYDVGRVQLGLVYVLAAVGLNVAYGLAGEFTLGHVFLMACGAYAAGIFTAHAGLNIWLALVLSLVVGIVVSLLLGAPSVRVQGAYLGLLTLFAVLAIPPAVILGERYTGGEYGLLGIPTVQLGGLEPYVGTYYLTVASLAVSFLVVRNLNRFGLGLRFALLREAPRAAQAVGMPTSRVKFTAYALFGAITSLAGVMMAYNDGVVVGNSFSVQTTLLILTGVVIGGKGTLWGPVVGTVPLVFLSYYVGPFNDTNPVIFGAALVLVVIAFPNGIVPAIRYQLLPWFTSRSALRSDRLTPDPVNATHMSPTSDGEPKPARELLPQTAAATESRKVILSASSLTRSFGGVKAINDLSLEVHDGEIVGLVGQNGCGKSTLLNLVSGFYRLDHGSVELFGVDLTGSGPARIARTGVGRTFQVPRLVPKATVVENIALGLVERDRPSFLGGIVGSPNVRRLMRERTDRAREMVETLGLDPNIGDEIADRLPLGLKRIIEVGRAAVAEPRLLLLDEPAAGLNDEERRQLAVTIANLSHRGITPLVVEHNMEFVLSLCSRVVLMESGSVVCDHRPAEALPMPQQMADYMQFAGVN